MFARLLFGIKDTPIGVDEFLIRCPSCEGYAMADVMVVSMYYHCCWIPVFPFEKDANVICNSCGLKRYNMIFDSTLVTNYNEVKGNFRHPWFTYTIAAIFILIFGILIAGAIFQ